MLAVGVGVSAPVYSFLQSLGAPPLRGEHTRDIQRLVRVPAIKTYPAYRGLLERVSVLDMGMYYRVKAGVGRGSSAAPVQLECISHTYLHLLGVRPLIGRMFEEHEDVEGGVPLLLLAHRYWARHFAEDPTVVGTTVELNARRYTVIGVAPREFGGVESRDTDAWTLLAASPMQCLGHDNWHLAAVSVVGRIRHPFTLAQAADEIASQRSAIAELNGRFFPMGPGVPVVPLYDPQRRAWSLEWRVLRWVGMGTAVAFLLVCANASVLLLLGVAGRREELVVRLQLGALRRQVVAQVLAETLALGIFCIAPAVVMAAWIAILMEALVPIGSVDDFLGLRGLGTVAALALGAGALSGVVPALKAARTGVNMTRAGGTGALTTRESFFRDVLLAGQVAIALVLAMTAGLFARSAAAAKSDLGYDLEHVIVASIDLNRTGFDAARAQSVFDLLLRRVRRVPVVLSAAVSSSSLLELGTDYTVLQLPGAGDALMMKATDISPSYFETLGTRLVRGRPFDSRDSTSGQPVMIISEGLAERLWPNGDALTSCAFVGFPEPVCADVVGISESRRPDTITQVDDEIFLPILRGIAPRVLLVRTHAPAHAAIDAVASAVQGALPDLPFVDLRPLAHLADAQTRAVRLAATMGGLLGGIVVILAGIGIYGAIAVSMRQRRSELGIRLALGARRGDVAWLIMRRGLTILATGWIVGSVVISAVTPAIAALVFGVTPLDPVTFLWATVVVWISVMIGVVVPTVRAAQVEPASALRV